MLPFANMVVKNKQQTNEVLTLKEIKISAPQLTLEYGIPIELYEKKQNTVKRNQYLSKILNSYGIDYKTIDNIAEKAKDVFDLRKIRSGKSYQTFCAKDSTKKLNYLVYQHTPTDYVVFDFSDSLNVYNYKKEVKTRVKEASCEIKTSLWNAMTSSHVNIELSSKLSDVFAWTINFFNLKKDDRFKVIYEEKYVDSVSCGVGNIHSVCFHHNGNDYYAFRYKQDSTYSYFDENGNSLKKAFLKAPLKYSRISSGFTYKRLHPIYKVYRPHTGIDYAAPKGTPVYALGDGTVIQKGYNGGAGNMLKIKHNSVYTTAYLHLSKYAKGVKKGTSVKQGQLIGYVGSTGASTGPHLDFRCWKNGKPINPLKIDAPDVKPLKKENMQAFRIEIEKQKAALQKIGKLAA